MSSNENVDVLILMFIFDILKIISQNHLSNIGQIYKNRYIEIRWHHFPFRYYNEQFSKYYFSRSLSLNCASFVGLLQCEHKQIRINKLNRIKMFTKE